MRSESDTELSCSTAVQDVEVLYNEALATGNATAVQEALFLLDESWYFVFFQSGQVQHPPAFIRLRAHNSSFHSTRAFVHGQAESGRWITSTWNTTRLSFWKTFRCLPWLGHAVSQPRSQHSQRWCPATRQVSFHSFLTMRWRQTRAWGTTHKRPAGGSFTILRCKAWWSPERSPAAWRTLRSPRRATGERCANGDKIVMVTMLSAQHRLHVKPVQANLAPYDQYELVVPLSHAGTCLEKVIQLACIMQWSVSI